MPAFLVVIVILWLMGICTVLFGLIVTGIIFYIRHLAQHGPTSMWEPILWFLTLIVLLSLITVTV